MTRTLFIAFWAHDTFVEVSCHTLRELRFADKMRREYNSHFSKSFLIHPNHTNENGQWYSSCEEAVTEFRELTLGRKSQMKVSISYFFFVINKEALPHLLFLLSDGEVETKQAILSVNRIYDTEIFIDEYPASNFEVMLILPIVKRVNRYMIDLNQKKVEIKNFSLS